MSVSPDEARAHAEPAFLRELLADAWEHKTGRSA